jgi:hypothetical protein
MAIRLTALIILYFHPLYVLVIKILSSIHISSAIIILYITSSITTNNSGPTYQVFFFSSLLPVARFFFVRARRRRSAFLRPPNAARSTQTAPPIRRRPRRPSHAGRAPSHADRAAHPTQVAPPVPRRPRRPALLREPLPALVCTLRADRPAVCLDPAALAARWPLKSAPGTAAASTSSAADSSKVLFMPQH